MPNAAIDNCILTARQMAEVDQLTISQLEELGRNGTDLMEEAGLSVVREIEQAYSGKSALVLCGPGNNGGDGFVIARHLNKKGWNVEVALLGPEENLKGDARYMAALWDGDIKNIKNLEMGSYDLIIDTIFGTGLSREISGPLKQVIANVNQANSPVIAVDIPSGIEGDTGRQLGASVDADMTVTFCRKKPAHLLYPSKERCGKIIITDIGIPDKNVEYIKPDIFINCCELWQDKLPKYNGDIHKYHKGHAVIVSGDKIHTGASRLAAAAAQRIGAGLVSISSPDDALDIHAAALTSIMIRKRQEISEDLRNEKFNSWCIGPAAGLTEETRQETIGLLTAGKKTVIDADAITVFENDPEELFKATRNNANSVLTPHAGEFKRIFPELTEHDKISAAREAAVISGAIVIYKGSDTVIANPQGIAVVSENAPSNLATAGSGDVLAGIVCGLMAQNMEIFDAACAAQWIHSECGNIFGPGLISEDLPNLIPEVLKKIE